MTPLQFLKLLDLQQEPPRIRTIMLADGGFKRLSFPWVSIGCVRYYNRVREALIYVFFHHRKWRTLKDALGVLGPPPPGFHTTEMFEVCVGDRANLLVAKKKMTPSEAFWMTENGETLMMPAVMLNTKNPNEVLNVKWGDLKQKDSILWVVEELESWKNDEDVQIDGWEEAEKE